MEFSFRACVITNVTVTTNCAEVDRVWDCIYLFRCFKKPSYQYDTKHSLDRQNSW